MICSSKIAKIIIIFLTCLIPFKHEKEILFKDKTFTNDNKVVVKDVLFINGYHSDKIGHPYRYRVLHQMEQLGAGFLESNEKFYLNFEPSIVRNYRVIIFFRCPWTKKVDEAISLAKNLNKKVLFDIDDLIINIKYTEMIPYLKTLSQKKKQLYDNLVKRIGKTLKLCDAAITSTEALAKELKKYVPYVYINRNVASEEMWKLSTNALKTRDTKTHLKFVTIGYVSGSITNHADLEMICPALLRILNEFKNVKILLLGELSFPKCLKDFSSKIIYYKNFIDWKKMPEIMLNVDINIAPIEYTIFNEAQSENKWVEAALVKVPTIASNFGAFKHMIIHNKTGILCNDTNDWYISLRTLINNRSLRKIIGENAYIFCKKRYNTIYTGVNLASFINSISNRHIGFFLPTINISGGIYVILKHACVLKDEGWDVDLILPNVTLEFLEFQNHKFNVINMSNSIMSSQYDIIVATLYTTLYSILKYFRTKNRLYLVQNYETDFYSFGNYFRSIAEKTYSVPFGVKYITISKWCESWLWQKYKKKSTYVPNGIDFDNYKHYRRELKNKKIRILIEGDSSLHYKNVDESFKIIEKIDKNKYEIWYLSYNGKPKEWYHVDKFFYKIPLENVSQIYYESDILLKSSWLESFSYPPLEMMATGGYCIVAPNDGNTEYLKDGENCLFYTLGDIDSAVRSIERLVSNENLQKQLYEYGIQTAKKRDWKIFKNQIISLYNNSIIS